jgi:hypothetical protein
MSPLVSFNSACLPSSVSFTLVKRSGTPPFVNKENSLFSLDHVVELLLHLRDRVRREPEACTPALHCRYNLIDVVAYNAKPDVFGILFDHTTEGCLGRGGHHVCFVKDDKFEAR